MKRDFESMAAEVLSGEWQYDGAAKTLKKYLGDADQFSRLNVLCDDNCLNEGFKRSILDLLGAEVLDAVVGPFGDGDIFCGIEVGESISYYVEMLQVKDSHVQFIEGNDKLMISMIRVV